jgi:uncharacterized protein
MENQEKIAKLRTAIERLYSENRQTLLFHGWHHIDFVSKKAVEFAQSISADILLVEAASLTHDLNYIVEPNSEPEVGRGMREKMLKEAGYTKNEIERIESIVMESHTGTRGQQISNEGKAVSDADTLFKSLPITPIFFASKYISQNKVDIYKLAKKVCDEQNPLMEQDIYFYTETAKQKYLKWAKANLALWNCVQEALQDKDVQQVLSIAQKSGVI